MTTIYWSPWADEAHWGDLTFYEPEPVLPYIAKTRSSGDLGHYIQCPAFRDYYKNMYMVRSPISITISYDRKTDSLQITPQDQKFYDNYIRPRGRQRGSNDPFLMSIAVQYLFLADAKCFIEQLPVTYHEASVASKIRLIPGTFDISQWYRPVEFAFEILDDTNPLAIKRGDPLFYVRFVTDDKVSLKYKEVDSKTREAVNACLTVKEGARQLDLHTLYTLALRVKDKLWFNKKKCPFNWRNK